MCSPFAFPAVFTRLFIFLLIGVLTLSLLLVMAIAHSSWRHRHVGTAGHTHGHAADHGGHHHHHRDRSHAHSHGHRHGHHHHHHGHHHHGHHHHGHDHSHGAGEHEHGREGWHVHFSFFGFELTIWEPDWIRAIVAERDEGETRAEVEVARTKSDGDHPRWIPDPPVSGGWISFLGIDWGPLPGRVRRNNNSLMSLVAIDSALLYDLVSDAPPVPPPRAAS